MKDYLLLIEDDEMTAYLIRKALEKNLFPGDVLWIDNGEKAIQHLLSKKSKPALILLDMGLPDISGLDVLETIRNTEYLTSLPVILQTASSYALREDQQRVRALGISRYMVKPIDLSDLVTQMSEVTEMFKTATGLHDESSNT